MSKSGSFGFVADGDVRMSAAIREQVLREFEEELTSANGYWSRFAVRKKMVDEISRRMGEVSSPQSLW